MLAHAWSQVDRNHSFIQPHKKRDCRIHALLFSPSPNGETVNWVTSPWCTEPCWACTITGSLCWCKLLLLSLASVACMHQNYTDSINTASIKTETSSLGNLWWKAWTLGILSFLLLSPARIISQGRRDHSKVKRLFLPILMPCSWLVIGFAHMWVLQHLN